MSILRGHRDTDYRGTECVGFERFKTHARVATLSRQRCRGSRSSPALQLLATIFGAFVVLMSDSNDNRTAEASELDAPNADRSSDSAELTGAARAF